MVPLSGIFGRICWSVIPSRPWHCITMAEYTPANDDPKEGKKKKPKYIQTGFGAFSGFISLLWKCLTLRAFPWFLFSSKDITDGYDQNYFADFYTNHVEMVQPAGSYFATWTPKLITLIFQHPKTPNSSLLLAGLTGQVMQGDFAWLGMRSVSLVAWPVNPARSKLNFMIRDRDPNIFMHA